MRQYYIDIAEGRNKSLVAFIIKVPLFILSLIYLAVVSLRNFLYDARIFKARKFAIPVISIGNLTWGGTGKTSLAILLAQSFSFRKVAVLTRGYGKDESELLKSNLDKENCRVFPGKNRLAILESIHRDYDLAIMDDGFQHRKLYRNLDIVLINGQVSLGKKLIPFGILREPISGVKRAHLAVITHCDNNLGLEEKLKKINPGLDIFYAQYRFKGVTDLQGKVCPKEDILRQPAACFCAIAYPQGFLNTLKSLGIEPDLEFIYPDHHDLKEEEFREIEDKCSFKGIHNLVITSKDKSRFWFPAELNIFVIEVDLKIDREEEFLGKIRHVLGIKDNK